MKQLLNNLLLSLLSILLLAICSYAHADDNEFDYSVTIPSWTASAIFNDSTTHDESITDAGVYFETNTTGAVSTSGRTAVYFEPLPLIPSVGDKRCLDDSCNYYLDVSDINISFGNSISSVNRFQASWGAGGNAGGQSGGSYHSNDGDKVLASLLSKSIVRVKKRIGVDSQLKMTSGKTVDISFKICDSGSNGWFYISVCNSLASGYFGPLVHLHITVTPPVQPAAQCYMTPWSNNISFNTVTLPVKSGEGTATWPLGGGFTGIEHQRARLQLQCSNVDTSPGSMPVNIKLSGSGWTYGDDGALFFGSEKSIAVAAKLGITSSSALKIADTASGTCTAYWKGAANQFDIDYSLLGKYMEEGSPACPFEMTLAGSLDNYLSAEFVLDTILGVNSQAGTTIESEPQYGEHTGTIMLEINPA